MSEPNPYAPPAESPDPSASPAPAEGAPAFRLYKPGHATLAAFLGTPGAGLYLVSVNRRRLGQTQAATNTLIAGLVATAALVVAGFFLPDGIGRSLPIAATIGVGQYAKSDRLLLDAHQARGGQWESGWKAAGIGLIGFVAAIAVIVAVTLATEG